MIFVAGPYLWKISNLTHIRSDGWQNHQLYIWLGDLCWSLNRNVAFVSLGAFRIRHGFFLEVLQVKMHQTSESCL